MYEPRARASRPRSYSSTKTFPSTEILVGSHRIFIDDICKACGVNRFDAVLDKTLRKCKKRRAKRSK